MLTDTAVLARPYVIVPTYNEAENIATLLKTLLGLPVANLQVVVIDDNSPDGTAAVVRQLQAHYPALHLVQRSGKGGLSSAYIAGFLWALEQGATAVVQMDADFSHDPHDIPRLLAQLTAADLVIGSRYVRGVSIVNWPLRRLLISIGGNTYARLVTGLPFKDMTGGFKVWRAAALREINVSRITAQGYGFNIVSTYACWKNKRRIIEVPIVFTERRFGQSKLSKNIIWEAAWLVWKVRFFSAY